MLSLFIFLILIIFKAETLGRDNDPQEITFRINLIKTNTTVENGRRLICDHNVNDIQQHIYTVREGELFKIITKYNSHINHIFCRNYNYNNDFYTQVYKKFGVSYFMAVNRMGTLWNCTVLTHRDVAIYPVVQYKDARYSAAYCVMKIHVRQTEAPQMILVNNMVLPVVQTNLSKKDVDFTAEYQYADGDVVNVTCANLLNSAPLTMEYDMAGTMSDNSPMKELLSYKAIGFRAKFHSGHNNSYMICTNTESTDYTKVMVRFIMRTEFNFISIKINGMTVRPKVTNAEDKHYDIEFKYLSQGNISVVCEVQRTDMNLLVSSKDDFVVLVPSKEAKIAFHLNAEDKRKLLCSADYDNGTSAEQVGITFTAANFSVDQYPLHMELSSNLPFDDKVLELYNDYKLKVIYYEFEDDEILQLKCGYLRLPMTGRYYLQFNDSSICWKNGCAVSETLHISRKDYNTGIACYLKMQREQIGPIKGDFVLKAIRLILRKRVLTTTSTTTTSPVTTLTTVITTTNTAADPASSEKSTYTLGYCISSVGGAIFIILVKILYWSVKKRCCVRLSSQELPVPVPTPRPHPDTVYYQNLLSVFQPINEREAAEMENPYEEVH